MAARVLIVDDEPSILSSTAYLLEDLGFEVKTRARIEGLTEELVADPPDLLLQDIRMPGLDIDTLLSRIRAEPKLEGVRVLLFSASLDLEEVAARVKADGVLDKPFKPNDLAHLIRTVIAKT